MLHLSEPQLPHEVTGEVLGEVDKKQINPGQQKSKEWQEGVRKNLPEDRSHGSCILAQLDDSCEGKTY